MKRGTKFKDHTSGHGRIKQVVLSPCIVLMVMIGGVSCTIIISKKQVRAVDELSIVVADLVCVGKVRRARGPKERSRYY